MNVTTDIHPLAGALNAHMQQWKGYTDGSPPLPVALWAMQRVGPWQHPGKAPSRYPVPFTSISVLFTLDARPLVADLKAPPKRVFYSGTLDIDVDMDLKVLKARVGRFEYDDRPGGRGVNVPSQGWRRGTSGYQGLSGRVDAALRAWAGGGALVPVLGPLIAARVKEAEREAARHDQDAQQERADIEAGKFDNWHTPERRARSVEQDVKVAQERREEASMLLAIAERVGAMGGADPEGQAKAALAARLATERAVKARQEAEGRALEAANAAAAARVRLEEEMAARARLEAAAPLLLEAAKAGAAWMEERALHGDVLTGLKAAIRQATGGAS